MRKFLTKKDVMSAEKTGRKIYGIVKTSKKVYTIAEILPGIGYVAIVDLQVEKPEVAFQLFHDLYQQLKGIMEGISPHH